MSNQRIALIDLSGNQVAELLVNAEENGWFYGEVLSQQFPHGLGEALARYNEVVENQTLSLLDEALLAVERFQLQAKYANGAVQSVFSLQLNADQEVAFRTSPVPPPAWLAKSESA